MCKMKVVIIKIQCNATRLKSYIFYLRKRTFFLGNKIVAIF